MHPWHDVELGDRIEVSFRVVVEIPRGSKVTPVTRPSRCSEGRA